MCSREQDEGDASVPSPHDPTPAPTGTKGLPKRHDKIPIRVSPTPAPMGTKSLSIGEWCIRGEEGRHCDAGYFQGI